MELVVQNKSGKTLDRKVKLNTAVFGVTPNDHAIYLDVKQYLAHQRQGTSSSKERSMLSGSTRKIKRQKGTGTARFGDIKNPIFRGGARVFGPQPRDYRFKLNKKVKRLARKSALTYKAQNNEIIVLEKFAMDAPKTKEFNNILKSLEVDNSKSLFVIPQADSNISLSSRNIGNSKVITADSINTYDILHCNKMIIVEDSMAIIDNMFDK